MGTIQPEKVVAIIVLYNKTLQQSASYKAFQRIHSSNQPCPSLILFNNSKHINIESCISVKTINAQKNQMLAGAYNYALQYANSNNFEWLMLIDDDTDLSAEYFQKLFQLHLDDQQLLNIAAIVPTLKFSGKNISPHTMHVLNMKRKSVLEPGLIHGNVTAFNSLSVLSLKHLNSLGGFPVEFPLDMLDYYLYNKFHETNLKVFLLDCKVNHRLSVKNFEEEMSIDRYRNLVKAELSFYSNFSFHFRLAFRVRLIYRTIKQFLFFKSKKFARITLRAAFYNNINNPV